MSIKSILTIMFEDPFWIGLYERIDGSKYEVCRIVFGSEPKDYEVYDFMLKNWHKLKFSPPIKADKIEERKINPKRLKREINRQLENKKNCTKAQEALKLQYEQRKAELKIKRQKHKEAEKERKFAQRQAKKKAKHRGR